VILESVEVTAVELREMHFCVLSRRFAFAKK
jgi:hypothetical protein